MWLVGDKDTIRATTMADAITQSSLLIDIKDIKDIFIIFIHIYLSNI